MAIPDRIGKYEIDCRLGGGGMAEVYLARLMGAESFSRSVAIKRVLPEYAGNVSFSEMFVREAQLSARLNHPNIVSVLDFDRDPVHGLFLAMEMVEGKDLNQLLGTGLLPISLVIHLVTEILRGLGYAHNLPMDDSAVRGIVHRDVSPHNVLLSWEGAVKVSDFGIAKARVVSNASASMVIKGKPAYMSPEQVNGKPLDGRSDLFAVGVMLWEMLVGQPLFGGRSTVEEVFAALVFSPIPSPRDARPALPADLSLVTLRLLQRDRDQRYAAAEDAIRDLLACRDAPRDGRAELTAELQARFPGQQPVRASRARKAALPPRDAPALEPLERGPSARTLGALFLAAIVLAAVATVAVIAFGGSTLRPILKNTDGSEPGRDPTLPATVPQPPPTSRTAASPDRPADLQLDTTRQAAGKASQGPHAHGEAVRTPESKRTESSGRERPSTKRRTMIRTLTPAQNALE